MIPMMTVLVVMLLATTGESATFYATSTSRGNATADTTNNCSTGARCTMRRALSLAVNPGDVVSAEANTISAPYLYQGANDMINPVSGRGGTSSAPIIVVCEGLDGGCLLDGQFLRSPVRFVGNSWWYIEGFNMKNGGPGSFAVINVSDGSNDNVFKKIVAWDAAIDQNNNVIGIHSDSSRNVFEDIAAFGPSRKVFSNSWGGQATTCRRCWIRWEGSTTGSSIGLTLLYQAKNSVYENVLVTWSGEMMPETHTPAAGGVATGASPQTNFNMASPVAILGIDRIVSATTPKAGDTAVRGAIIYTKVTDRMPSVASATVGSTLPGIALWGTSNLTITDIVRIMAPAHPRFNDHSGIGLVRRPQNCPEPSCGTDATPPTLSACLATPSGPGTTSLCENPVANNVATRLTSIRGTHMHGSNQGDSYGTAGVSGKANETDWASGTTNVIGSTTYTYATMHPWQNDQARARMCYRWGTTTPLWPWPMNERIKQATYQADKYTGPCSIDCKTGGVSWMSGSAVNLTPRPSRRERAPLGTDVTADMELLLGTIPAACRSGTVVGFPPAPTYTPGILTSF